MHAAAPRGVVEGRVRGAAPRLAAKDLDKLLLERVAEGKDVTNVGDRAAVMAAADATANVPVVRRRDARLAEVVLASDRGPEFDDIRDVVSVEVRELRCAALALVAQVDCVNGNGALGGVPDRVNEVVATVMVADVAEDVAEAVHLVPTSALSQLKRDAAVAGGGEEVIQVAEPEPKAALHGDAPRL